LGKSEVRKRIYNMCPLIVTILAVLGLGLAVQVWVLFRKVLDYEENERRYWDEPV